MMRGFPEQFKINNQDVDEQASKYENNSDLIGKSQQYLEEIILEMEERSRFLREKITSFREKIFSPEKGEFFIDRITNPNTSEAEEICKFIGKFDPEEVDVNEIKINIQDDRYAYYVVREKERIVGCIQNSHIENLDNQNEVLVFIGHVIIAPEYWRKGLAMEMYQSVFERCFAKA